VGGAAASASVRFTVENPEVFHAGSLGGSGVPYNNGNESGYQTVISYSVYDQMSPPNPIGVPGIPATELLSTISNPYGVSFDPPDGTPRTALSDTNGEVWDKLSATAVGGLPAGFTATRSQGWTVNGFAFAGQTQTYFLTYGTIQNQDLARQQQ